MMGNQEAPQTNQREQADKSSALTLWTMLTALAVCGSYLLAWAFLIILSWVQG